jgi:hypothetical protein
MNRPFDLPLEKEQLKNMSAAELDLLAVAIREELIETVSGTGGHFASNLGVVELTLALEKVFDTPRDKVIWDVGHQTYVHKMLTGRWNELKSLRQIDGRTQRHIDLRSVGLCKIQRPSGVGSCLRRSDRRRIPDSRGGLRSAECSRHSKNAFDRDSQRQ